MKKQANSISAGLAFMQAAAAAMPKSLGDREYGAAMGNVMSLAVRNRFAFDRNDAEALDKLRFEGAVVFRPLDYYLGACRFGGTYARMWELHHGQKPWMADRAVFPAYIGGYDDRQPFTVEDNRIAVRAGALLPGSDDPDLATFEGLQVWFCTSMTDDTITLCRYAVTDEVRKYHGRNAPLSQQGKPARIRKLSRAEWQQWNQQANELRSAELAA
ncbi:hypothetical protein AB4Y45_32245 [Paraburkholderia sp. EG287A]|uniref:hypothetical protein n=1 Tax=Paraburkholderia sp. EG287A TaxID=3237012 RepID=UPI0034D2CE34